MDISLTIENNMDGIWAFYLVYTVVILWVIIFVMPAAKALRKNKNKK